MSNQLRELLDQVVAGAPPADAELGDEVDAILRRADGIRLRRTRSMIAAGGAALAGVAVIGYLITTTLLAAPPLPTPPPEAGPTRTGVVVPATIADPVLAIIAPLMDGKKLHVSSRAPELGSGWRRYWLADATGQPRGEVDIAVYASPTKLCFPVLAAPKKCAHPEKTPSGIDYVRYDDEKGEDRKVHQAIARRVSDGRTLAVMATGEPRTGDAAAGQPALTGAEVQRIATDPRLIDAFSADGDCHRPSTVACPVFRVPVPSGAEVEATDDKKKKKGAGKVGSGRRAGSNSHRASGHRAGSGHTSGSGHKVKSSRKAGSGHGSGRKPTVGPKKDPGPKTHVVPKAKPVPKADHRGKASSAAKPDAGRKTPRAPKSRTGLGR